MEKLDDLLAKHLAERLLQSDRLETILASVVSVPTQFSAYTRTEVAEGVGFDFKSQKSDFR